MGCSGMRVEKSVPVMLDIGLAVAVPFSRVTSNGPPIFCTFPVTVNCMLSVSICTRLLSGLRWLWLALLLVYEGTRRFMSLIMAFAERLVDIKLI